MDKELQDIFDRYHDELLPAVYAGKSVEECKEIFDDIMLENTEETES